MNASGKDDIFNSLISVILPVFNGERFISQAVQSILHQTYSDFELIIINDGSTDGTLNILRDFQTADSRIRLITRANRGLATSLNEGIAMARGQWIARMDADDVSHPNRLSHQFEKLKAQPDLDIVATRAITIDDNDQVIGLFPGALSHCEICARPWNGFYFPHPTWMGRTEWFRKYYYAQPAPLLCEDQELLLRSYKESKFATLDEFLLAYRIPSHVNWTKLAQTRVAVLGVQFSYFMKQHALRFALLSIITFFIKYCMDAVKRILSFESVIKNLDIDKQIKNDWKFLLHSDNFRK
jgi:glycosyltransferase involved in cell wall biosynthesis